MDQLTLHDDLDWFEVNSQRVRDITNPNGEKVCIGCGWTGKTDETYCPSCGLNLKLWPWRCKGCENIQVAKKKGFKFQDKRFCDKECAERNS